MFHLRVCFLFFVFVFVCLSFISLILLVMCFYPDRFLIGGLGP